MAAQLPALVGETGRHAYECYPGFVITRSYSLTYGGATPAQTPAAPLTSSRLLPPLLPPTPRGSIMPHVTRPHYAEQLDW